MQSGKRYWDVEQKRRELLSRMRKSVGGRGICMEEEAEVGEIRDAYEVRCKQSIETWRSEMTKI